MSYMKESPVLVTSNIAGNLDATRKICVLNPLPLMLLILVVDLFTPLPMGRGLLPGPIRWISQAIIAVLIFWAFVRMIVWDRIPGIAWLFGFGSVVWITVAILHGQGIGATIWGWWVMFQYPLLGLFAYLQPVWPKFYSKRLRDIGAIILGLQVILQIIQYLRGRAPGDHLSGLFGWFGTGKLLISILFVLCLALGHWLSKQKWMTLAWVIVLGSISSALGEMKFYAIAVAALCGLAVFIYQFQRKRPWMMVPYGILLVAIVSVFILLYNFFVPGAAKIPLEEFFSNPMTIANYLNQRTTYTFEDNNVFIDVGRNYAVAYAWESMRSDPSISLFGLGIGARVESRSLGIAGIGLLQGDLGKNSGTSLMVFMQELGLVGMVTMAGFFLWIILSLLKGIRNHPRSVALELRYALLLFSLLWPLWLWYNAVWTLRVPMWLYWTTLGYVMSDARGNCIQG